MLSRNWLYPLYKDRSGFIVGRHDYLENGDGIYKVLSISAEGIEVIEVTFPPEGDEEIGMIEVGEPWIKTRSEVAKCDIW